MPGPQVCVGNPDMSGYAIYQAMKGGPVKGPGSIHDAASAATKLQTALGNVETSLRNYQSSITAGIQGTSGTGAHEAAGPVIDAVSKSQSAMGSYNTQLTNQSSQFTTRANALHDIAQNPPDAGFWDRAGSGWGLWGDDPQDKLDEYNKQANENKLQFGNYSQDSYDHYQQMPDVDKNALKTVPNVDVYDPSRAKIDHTGTNNLNVNGHGNGTGSGNTGNVGGGGTGHGGSGGTGGGGGGNPPGGGGGGGGTTTPPPGGFHPVSPVPPGTDPSQYVTGPGGAGYPGGTLPSGVGGNSSGANDFGMPPPIAGGGLGGFGDDSYSSSSRGGYGGSAFGDEGGFGSSGAGGAGSGAGAGGRGSAGTGAGARSGAGAFGGEEGFGGARGGAGAGAGGRGGGFGGGPMGGGRGGKKEDDGEHQMASYLVTEDNGNELVGDLPLTAPPVIGD